MVKKFINKLTLSIITLSLVVFTLGTSTFAWFSLSDTNEVTDINITVGGGEAIQLSLNGKDYYSVIPSSVLMNYIKGNNGDQELCFHPVTSLDGRNVQNLNGDVLKTVEDGVNVQFIKLKIYFRATDINDPVAEKYGLGVYLSDFNPDVNYDEIEFETGTYIISKGIRARADVDYVDYDQETGEAIDIHSTDVVTKYASDAVRVAFFDNQYTLYGTQDLATKCYDLSNRNGKTLSAYGYGYGYSNNVEDLKGAASYYYEKTRNLLEPSELTMPVYDCNTGFSEFGSDDRAMYANNQNGFICILTPVDVGTYEGYATMLIWLEGYDPDCYNVIANDNIVISLNFRLAYKAIKEN